jgi:hypothetical protein
VYDLSGPLMEALALISAYIDKAKDAVKYSLNFNVTED